MDDFKDLTLADQVDYFSPALGLKDKEIMILYDLVVNAPVNPTPQKIERELDLKRSFVKATFEKLESKGYVKFGEDTLDFSGLIKALKEIPLEKKKRLFDKMNDKLNEPLEIGLTTKGLKMARSLKITKE